MPSVCTLGDISKSIVPDVHGCPACPHPMVTGPAISASGNVKVGGKPALRVGDNGIHCACCGPNTWVVEQGSGQVVINGQPCVRVGDKTQHCGSKGKMITGSAVVVDGSAAGGFMPLGPYGPGRSLGPFGDYNQDSVCGAAFGPAALYCDADACATAIGGITACGAAACYGAACGGNACGGAVCGAAACGGEACGAAGCAADAALASACAVDIAPADACLADACAVNVVPVVPGI